MISLLYLLPFRSVVNMDPDEGIVLQGAHRILAGQVPYRDFFTFYTPGSFYLTAALFKVLGDSILVARTALVFFGATFTVITFSLVRRTCSTNIALLVSVLTLMTTTPYRFLALHNWDSSFWACLSVYCAVRWIEDFRWIWPFLTGTLASLTFVSEQSKGAGVYLGLALAVLIFAIYKRPLKNLHYLLAGAVWPILFVFAFFGLKHSIAQMLDAWMWPFHHYSAANHVPYGDQSWSGGFFYQLLHTGTVLVRIITIVGLSPGLVVPVLPLVAVGMWPFWLSRLKNKGDQLSAHYVLVSSLIFGLLASVVAVRADINHFMYLAPLFYLPLAWMLGSPDLSNRFVEPIRPVVLIYSVVAFGILGLAVFFTAIGSHERIATRHGNVRARGQDTVVEYVQNHTTPGDELLVYPYLPLYNYLSDTISPAHLDYYQPGMNTPEQAQEIILSLQSQHAPVLLEPAFAEKIPRSWPGTPLAAIASDPVSDYIIRNYRVCKMLRSPLGWQFEYMLRKDEPCP